MHAFNAYEGYKIGIEGTEGRLEYNSFKDTSWNLSNVTVPGSEEMRGQQMRLFLPGKGVEDVEIPVVEGSHGGADPQLREDFFGRDWDEPVPERMASLSEAVQAVLIGAAANKSIATDRPVHVQSLLSDA